MAYGLRSLLPRAARRIRAWTNPPIVNARERHIGRHVRIEQGVEINCDRLVLGDGVTIKAGTRINVPDLVIGDYTTISENCLLDGSDWCRIGHNCWIGHFAIIDSKGTTRIGDGVGIGAHSQLWTHAYFGDVLNGCRFASQRPLVVEDEVWFVGHCIVSPIHAKRRSMAMVGSVVTRDMEDNHVYAGVPAKDVTDKLGPQFDEPSLARRREQMQLHLSEFRASSGLVARNLEIVDTIDLSREGVSQFGLIERCYTKRQTAEEVAFMRYLLPTRAKFLPHAKSDWVRPFLAGPTSSSL